MVEIIYCIAIYKYFLDTYISGCEYETKNGVMIICMATLTKKVDVCKRGAGIYIFDKGSQYFPVSLVFELCVTILTCLPGKSYSRDYPTCETNSSKLKMLFQFQSYITTCSNRAWN